MTQQRSCRVGEWWSSYKIHKKFNPICSLVRLVERKQWEDKNEWRTVLESVRLNTIKNWPLNCIHLKNLAAVGFNYCPITSSSKTDTVYLCLRQIIKDLTIGYGRVRCFARNLEVSGWHHGDDSFADHKLAAPNCRFVRLLERMRKKWNVFSNRNILDSMVLFMIWAELFVASLAF